jgi:glycosyltransferase involved in cell wall biosynthesis
LKALLLSPYPSSAPSNRNRIDQYIPYLEAHGMEVAVDCLLDEVSYRSRGVRHAFGVLSGMLKRALIALRPARFDVVLVHREALPFPTTVLERVLKDKVKRLVFDFDDAIYLPQPFPSSPVVSWLRSPRKFGAMISAADVTIAGNGHLAERAIRYSSNVVVIPTPVDTERITPRTGRRSGDRLVIGWMGSGSTAHYLAEVAEPLSAVLRQHPHVELAIVGAGIPRALRQERVSARPWSLSGEAEDLQSFDIGIMPLPDNEWTRGKCAYKALQYMSAGVATVSSAVGVTPELVIDGENGLLARSKDEWMACLSSLIGDAGMRWRLGKAGRDTVVGCYSVNVWAPRFLAALTGEGLTLRPARTAMTLNGADS